MTIRPTTRKNELGAVEPVSRQGRRCSPLHEPNLLSHLPGGSVSVPQAETRITRRAELPLRQYRPGSRPDRGTCQM